MGTVESVRGAFKRGKRGAVVFENEHGTLETKKVTNGQGSFVGSCIIGNRETTRTMVGDKYAVRDRWISWQEMSIQDYKKEMERKEMEKKEIEKKDAVEDVAAMSKGGAALLEYTAAILKQLEALNGNMEQIAISLMEVAEAIPRVDRLVGNVETQEQMEIEIESEPIPEPTVEDGIEAFLDGKTWLYFVNMPTKKVFETMYTKFVKNSEVDYPMAQQRGLTNAILEKFGNLEITSSGHGTSGRIFVPKQEQLEVA